MEKVIKDSIEKLKEAISGNEYFNEIQRENSSLVGPYVEGINTELDNLKELIDKEVESEDQAKSHAYKLLIHTQNVQSSAALLESFLITAQTTPVFRKIIGALQNAANWVKNHLIPWLKNLWSSVWGVIQKLITPKEWKLSGELGTGIFGFAKTSIEITFG